MVFGWTIIGFISGLRHFHSLVVVKYFDFRRNFNAVIVIIALKQIKLHLSNELITVMVLISSQTQCRSVTVIAASAITAITSAINTVGWIVCCWSVVD